MLTSQQESEPRDQNYRLTNLLINWAVLRVAHDFRKELEND